MGKNELLKMCTLKTTQLSRGMCLISWKGMNKHFHFHCMKIALRRGPNRTEWPTFRSMAFIVQTITYAGNKLFFFMTNPHTPYTELS